MQRQRFAKLSGGFQKYRARYQEASDWAAPIRVRRGLEQADVARRMGLDPSMISIWERGKRL